MAPVIWGLNLGEIQWGKFKNSNMWNNKYHLRRTKFIVYQLAMIFCVVSESLGTASLSNYLSAQEKVWNHNHRAQVHNNNYIGAASYNIFAGVFNATIFGAAFFFDLFWPERYESKNVRIAWKATAILACMFVLSSALTLTIITADKAAYITGVPYEEGLRLNALYTKEGGAPLKYRHNGRAVAAVVFIWPGFVCTIASCVIMFYSIDHWELLGPKSTHERNADEERTKGGLRKTLRSGNTDPESGTTGDGVRRPEATHRQSGNTALTDEEKEKWVDAPEPGA